MPSVGPQQLRDSIVKARVHNERDKFIATIREEQVCALASSYHRGDNCRYFAKPVRGSYNICFFVTFDDGDKWVVRIPLAPCLAFEARSKLESEVATMLVISERTDIPIPKVVAYDLGESSGPLTSFLILEYVEGEKLSFSQLGSLSDTQREHLYHSLAEIYTQLRRLEFSFIGCLRRLGQGGTEVSKMTTSIDINMQELEGLNPSRIQASYYKNGSLTSANAYTSMLLDIADNAFAQSRSSVIEDEDEVDYRFDQGPFVLVHGDLEPFNLIVNDEMDIVCVLDWEWSRIVPCQFFKPPLWFANPDPTVLAYDFMYQRYIEQFDQFLAAVRTLERKRYGNELLSNEWAAAKKDSGFLVANALENWTDIDWFAFRYINKKCYQGEDLEERVKAFMDEVPARKLFVKRKLREGITYTAEVKALGDKMHNEADAAPSGEEQPGSHLVQDRCASISCQGVPPSAA
ncbi:phosphotransferase enzyme family protein [Biscogniauxia marginata]|nr:phosphotransferase enzyme family protein [Biscogniauxia marginata]